MKLIAYILIWLLLPGQWVLSQQPEWRLASGSEGYPLYSIDVYRGDPDTIYGNANEYFMRSTDNGEHWENVAGWSTAGFSTVRVDPADSKTIYVSRFSTFTLESNDVIMSTDGGSTWRMLFAGRLFPTNVVEIDPWDPSTVYVGVGPAWIFRSPDRGVTWDTIAQPPGYGLVSLAIAQTNDSILYAGYTDGTFKSTDRGSSWMRLDFYPQPTVGPLLAIDPTDANVVYATIYPLDTTKASGVFKTTDGGLTWNEKNNGLSASDRHFYALTINPENAKDIFIAVSQDTGNLLFRSTDGAGQWNGFGDGLPNPGGIAAIAIDTLNNRAFAGGGATGAEGCFILDSLTTAVGAIGDLIPPSPSLSQNYPNPFNVSTRISYSISYSGPASLKVFDLAGREIAVLFDGKMHRDNSEVIWNADLHPSGVYFYQLTERGRLVTRRMLLVK